MPIIKWSSWRFQNNPNLWSLDDFEPSNGNLKKIKVSRNNFDWHFSSKYKQILNYLKTPLFSYCHNLTQNYPIFTSWGCFGIVRSSSCWWAQRFWGLMHPRLSNLRKTSAQILMTPTVCSHWISSSLVQKKQQSYAEYCNESSGACWWASLCLLLVLTPGQGTAAVFRCRPETGGVTDTDRDTERDGDAFSTLLCFRHLFYPI